MPSLDVVIKYVKTIDERIKDLRRGMAHADPYTVDILRAYLKELEEIKDTIMRSELQSGYNLDQLMYKVRDCIRECVNPIYQGKAQVLPTPEVDIWKPPVTVTGVNVIFYCDVSESMFSKGGLAKGGRIRNLLIAFAKEIDKYAKQAGIPSKVSLVTYADPTDKLGKNRPTFWTIELNKAPTNRLDDAFDNINRAKWAFGMDHEEEGMTAMYKTIDTVVDKSIVNGKPVENSVILISDERQKMAGSEYPPHPNYPYSVSFSQIDGKFKQLGIQNRYALIPMTKGYTNYNSKTGAVGRVNWNRDVRKFFTQCKEYWDVYSLNDIRDWVKWTLDPSSITSS